MAKKVKTVEEMLSAAQKKAMDRQFGEEIVRQMRDEVERLAYNVTKKYLRDTETKKLIQVEVEIALKSHLKKMADTAVNNIINQW